MKNIELNYQQISTDPIGGFANKLNANLRQAIDEFVDYELLDNKAQTKKINELTNQINQAYRDIENKRIELQYEKNLKRVELIGTLFYFLIGFLFYGVYKKALWKIEEFERFKNYQLNLITNLTNQRFPLMYAALSTIKLIDVYKFVYNKLGFQVSELIPAKQILQMINNPTILDVQSGIFGLYKDTPFFDVVVKTLYYDTKVTSVSETFKYKGTQTYEDASGFKYVREAWLEETLTAYHREYTPYFGSKNYIYLLTNFEPTLLFSINDPTYVNKETEVVLENKAFSDCYDVQYTYGSGNSKHNQQKMLQFFTIKAQEDYVKWHQMTNGYVYPFKKYADCIEVENIYKNVFYLNKLYKTIDSLGVLENNVGTDFEILKNRLKNLIFDYFQKVIGMLQMPLLSPAINREWFKGFRTNYQIWNETKADATAQIKNLQEFDEYYLPNRFLDNKYLWFLNTGLFVTPTWFNNTVNMKVQNEINYCEYDMNTFTKDSLIENIQVTGQHVGVKTISVPYDKFHKISEKKYIMNLEFLIDDSTTIIVTHRSSNLIDQNVYDDPYFSKFVLKNFVWTNNPLTLVNFAKRKELEVIIERFNQINYKYNSQLVLIIDMYGAYVISNQVSLWKIKSDISKILFDIRKLYTL